MPTEHLERERGGFTLIEVLVAMVILSVGLLGLESLGIGAAKSIAKADAQSRYTAAATRATEVRQEQIRESPGTVTTGSVCGTDADSGLYLCTVTQTHTSDASVPQHSALITVNVADTADGPFFTVSSYVYHPTLP